MEAGLVWKHMEVGLVWTHRDTGLDNRETGLDNKEAGLDNKEAGLDNKEDGLHNKETGLESCPGNMETGHGLDNSETIYNNIIISPGEGLHELLAVYLSRGAREGPKRSLKGLKYSTFA